MKTKKSVVARPWALVVAILFTFITIRNLFNIDFSVSAAYASGEVLGALLVPALFYFLAFKPKRKNTSDGE